MNHESRVPPQNLSAERSVLGCQILDAKMVDTVREIITPEDFFSDVNSIVQKAILKIHDDGGQVDVVTVATQLDSVGDFAEIGGTGYLFELMESVPYSTHAPSYAKSIKDCSRRRQTIEIGRLMIESAHDASRSDVELFTIASSAIAKLGESVSGLQTFATMTSAELDAADLHTEYLVEGILAKGQPCIIAASKKSLKTTFGIDLTLSLASGDKVLGQFYVSRPVRVALMSGESGDATIQETARRIAKSKQWINLADYEKAVWSFDLPRLGHPQTKLELKKFILQNALEVLIVDPAYLCLDLGDDAGNLFSVGKKLNDLSVVGRETSCTIIIIHHNKKAPKENPFAVPELESIAWSGFQEWARQWILLGRREAYNPEVSGSHKLWLSVGGSAGHSGLWAVDVEEGSSKDQGGRKWDVKIQGATESITNQIEEREQTKAEKADRKNEIQVEADATKLLKAYAEFPNGATAKDVRELAGVNGVRFAPANARLLQAGRIKACRVLKSNHKYDGFILVSNEPDVIGSSRVQPGPDNPGPASDVTGSRPAYRGGPAHTHTPHSHDVIQLPSDPVDADSISDLFGGSKL